MALGGEMAVITAAMALPVTSVIEGWGGGGAGRWNSSEMGLWGMVAVGKILPI